KSNDHGNPRQTYGLSHDLGREICVFDLLIDSIEDEYAHYLAPRVQGCNGAGHHQGCDRSEYWHKVRHTREHSQCVEIADFEEPENNRARGPENQHQGKLAIEPALHPLCSL